MPETPSTPWPSASDGTRSPAVEGQRAFASPVLLRALVALAFGAVTVFWGAPSAGGAAWCFAAYFVGLAVARAWLLRQQGLSADPGARPSATLRIVASVAYGLAAALGLGLGAAPEPSTIGIGGAIALALTGAADLASGIAGRRRSPLARDEVITGAVHLGAGALLPFFLGLGVHALLGVAGGAAIITGVLLAIAGLSLRQDSPGAARVA
ncbi:hypothetical protein GCM10027449_00080 [Sinomonas notoginsengisoli]|uniref:hypothetical protein n=1 Tax=Sinomonas notoginsengisoli TaxID=1457311 RepID=UPI001F3F332B|nr:hypothetical protein [Sinomonas notoginsengisoli]